jgi:hypothetical protein
MRHYARRNIIGTLEIVDRDFDFVRAILPYDYRYTCNSQQWDEAKRICEALEGPMISQGVVTARVLNDDPQ